MDQVTFNSGERTDTELIKEALVKEIKNTEYTEFLSIEEKKDGIISICAKSILAARAKLTHKTKYLLVREKYKSYFSNYIQEHNVLPKYEKKENDLWVRIPISSLADIMEMIEPISAVYMTVLADFGGERFGCCSRYEQCSDARKCIHPDFILSRACAYRKNLESGKIFYGKNRNID